MIKDKQKVEKIYNYLTALTTVHDGSPNKYCGWSLYNKTNKKLGFSVQKYNWDNIKYSFDLEHVDFNHNDFWFGERDNIRRIHVRINIACDFSKLEIVKCKVKDGACLVNFFKNLDDILDNFTDNIQLLIGILNEKGE